MEKDAELYSWLAPLSDPLLDASIIDCVRQLSGFLHGSSLEAVKIAFSLIY